MLTPEQTSAASTEPKPNIDLRAYNHDIDFSLSEHDVRNRSQLEFDGKPYPPMATLLAIYQTANGSWEARRESMGGGLSKRCESRKHAIEYLLEDLSHTYRFWDDKVAFRRAGDVTPDGSPVIRSNGTHYTLAPEQTRYPVRGFGGSKFRFQLIDTEELIESTNVWYQGRIPREFRNALPDNALTIPLDRPTLGVLD